MLGWNGDAQVYMIWRQMPFENLAFLLPRQPVGNPGMVKAVPVSLVEPRGLRISVSRAGVADVQYRHCFLNQPGLVSGQNDKSTPRKPGSDRVSA
jgi:hypothetical protein